VWSIGELGALYPATEGWYELAMDFSGSQITCSINGNVLPNGTWTDGEFSGGGFGVYYFDFSDMAGHLRFFDVVVEGEDSAVAPPQLPQGLSLGNPWPNPFNPVVHVDLQLDAAALVTARVYDLGGRVVRTLSVGPLAAGRHTLSWDGRADDGRPAASGSYLLSVDDGRAARRTRLTLLR